MKRSEALTPLSHDHHQALFVAQRLRRATSSSDQAAEGTPDPEHVARVANEHLEIRALAMAVAEGGARLEQIHQLGELMQAHVRYEERELFPLIEGDLDASAQERLAAAVLEAESA